MSFRILTAASRRRTLLLVQNHLRPTHLPRRCSSSLHPSQPHDPVQTDVPPPTSQYVYQEPPPPSIDPEKVHLPPEHEWRKHFPLYVSVNHRVSIRHAPTAKKIAEAFVPEGSKDKVIVEAFPGPGQLTRALLDLPKERIKRLIVMEDWEPYLQYLRPLELADPRVKIVNRDGYTWDSYQRLGELGLLDDVPKLGWEEGVHPTLQFISHIPSTVMGEQLVAQFFRSIPERQWLFVYGRVPISFILSEMVSKRVTATITDIGQRCKVSVVAEAVADSAPALPYEALQPFEEHFHPVRAQNSMSAEKKKSPRAVGNPFTTLTIIPKEKQLIKKGDMDAWDYCLRHLFVRKATALSVALPGLAPGAQTLVKKITDPNLPESERVDVRKRVRTLTADEWALVAKAFNDWPFAPSDLSIGDSFVIKERLG
ncbi:Mitochondrial transcription factor 1 [Hypsizygus marmoreus]|uniref:rRNA adenine N(6)-methyltransferase n=1 Tax=Hypsizygus marmoreus TaxID=39966 RepID=A0A369J4F8_HYPMA|nr:Mitochondrial transcription factor 1 [Hypsizygus marmoreus]